MKSNLADSVSFSAELHVIMLKSAAGTVQMFKGRLGLSEASQIRLYVYTLSCIFSPPNVSQAHRDHAMSITG